MDGGTRPWIDPEMQAILDAQAKLPPAPDPWTLPIAEARELRRRAMLGWNHPAVAVEAGGAVVPGASPVAVRWFRPKPGPLPAILFCHGGGWTFGTVETHERAACLLAQAAGALVVSVEYRLAPEHPFPAANDDARAAWAWLQANGAALGWNGKAVVAGDSAGANIALGLAVRLRDEGAALPAGAVLFYGCYAPVFDTDAHRQNGDGRYVLSSAWMRWFWGNWLGVTSPFHPVAAPLHADPAGLPPMHLVVAARDPLADDSWLLAERLARARVPHEVALYDGVVHGFMQMSRELGAARRAIAEAGRAVQRMCG